MYAIFINNIDRGFAFLSKPVLFAHKMSVMQKPLPEHNLLI